MPVNITWVDQSSREDSHAIMRKPVGSDEYTTVATIPSQPSSNTGPLEFLDMEELPPGDYTYTVANVDVDTGLAGVSNEYTITSIDSEKRELCIAMTQDVVDRAGVHYTVNNGTTINTAVSATEFDGSSHIQTIEALPLDDVFSISLNINPSSSRTTSGKLFISRLGGTTLVYHLELTVDGGVVFKYRNISNSLITSSTPTGVILSDTWNHLHITKDSSHILKFYVDTVLVHEEDCQLLSGNGTAGFRTDIFTSVRIGSDYDNYSAGYVGMMKELSIVNGQVVLPNSCVECLTFVPLELLPPDNIQVSVVYPEANFVSPPADVSVSIQVPPDIEYLYPPRDVVASMIYS